MHRPLVFQRFIKKIKEKIGGRIDVFELPVVDIYGKGCSTERLVEVADKIVKDAKILYQNKWLVFDKDDFKDFDLAIERAEKKGYSVAWSNQSFEYWIYLHFHYSSSAFHRDELIEKLNRIFKKHSLGDGKYKKNYVDIYDMVNSCGSVDRAIKNAKS